MGIRRGIAATGTVVVLLCASACSQTKDEPGPAQDTTPTAGGPTPTAPPTIDPAVVMDPPGPRSGPIASSDMILIGNEPFDPEVVESIRGLRDVTRIVQFSWVQVPIENRLLSVAAVDPSTYRNYTPPGSAEAQEVWDRVAGGEMAVSKELQERLPLDENGYLKLGVKAEDPLVHVGAFADQSPLVDAVVNELWAERLPGTKIGNALLVSTGSTAPRAVRKAVERAAGVRAQLTDIAAQLGLDPSVPQPVVVVGTVAQVVGTFTYTVLGGGRIAPEPAWVASHISTEVVPILGSVTCNRYMMPQLRQALLEIEATGLADKIHPGEYAGCYYPRFIAGSTTLSNHSFGLALDLNVPGNQRGTVGEMDRLVVDIFKRWGFAWGGDWSYTDPMHFEMDRIVSVG